MSDTRGTFKEILQCAINMLERGNKPARMEVAKDLRFSAGVLLTELQVKTNQIEQLKAELSVRTGDDLEYKGYTGSVIFHHDGFGGTVLNINDCLVYSGHSIEEITEMFHEAIDEYLEDCSDQGVEPDKPNESLEDK